MSHELTFTHKQELKSLKADIEKERKAALKKIKNKKEKKAFISSFKKVVKQREEEMLARHVREIQEESIANNIDESTSDEKNTDQTANVMSVDQKTSDVDAITTKTNNISDASTTSTPTSKSTVEVKPPTTSPISLLLPPPTSLDATENAPMKAEVVDDDEWEQVTKKVRNKKPKKGKRMNKKSKASGTSSTINKKALGALISDAICTELRRFKSKKILSLGCRTEAQFVPRVRDCAPLVDSICCVDHDVSRVQQVMESIVGSKSSFSTRPRQKALNVQLIVGSPWYWTTQIYDDACDEEMIEVQDQQGDETKGLSSSPNLTEELMKKVMTCGGDTVVLAMVLETMPHAKCLQRLETYIVDVLKPKKIIIAAANREFNPIYNLHGAEKRDEEHTFEWSRLEFCAWAGKAFGACYGLSFSSVGSPPKQSPHGDIGDAVQLCILTREQLSFNGTSLQQEDDIKETPELKTSPATPASNTTTTIPTTTAVSSTTNTVSSEEFATNTTHGTTETEWSTDLTGYELFSAAATSIFQAWPIFTFSKTHETGGDTTIEKIDRIIEDVLYNFEERWDLALSSTTGERPKLSMVYVDEIAPFLYDVLESDLCMQVEDGSPEILSAHIIRMFDECLEHNYSEAKKALSIALFKKKKENHNSVLLAEEGKDATAAFHGDCDDQDDIVERSWKPLTGSIQCHDIHTHGEGERSHGNSLQQSNASFCKSVKHATKKSNKQTRQKSSWNKNQ